MNFNRINLKDEFLKKPDAPNALLLQVADLFRASVKKEENIHQRLGQPPQGKPFDFQQLDMADASRVLTLEGVKKVCLKYNLRFLDTVHFKAPFPYEAVLAIKRFEEKYGVIIDQFKIAAPADVFQLEECHQDPVLFARLSDNQYYLLHQWGKDLTWYRAILAYPIKNIYTYFMCMWIPAIIIAFGIPVNWLQTGAEHVMQFRLWLTVHTFIALFFFTLFIGSTARWNFSEQCWNKKQHND